MKKIFKGIAVLAATAAVGTGVAFAAGCGGTDGVYYGEYHYVGQHSDVPYGMVVEVTVKNNIITNIKDITNTDAAKDYQTYKDVRDGKEAAEATYHAFTVVSPGWETYFAANAPYWLLDKGKNLVEPEDKTKVPVDKSKMLNKKREEDYVADGLYFADIDKNTGKRTGYYIKWEKGDDLPTPAQTNVYSYGWTDANSSNWSSHESWLLQQYVGWSVADILDIDVYTNFGYKLVTGGRELDTDSMGEPYGTDYNVALKDSELLITGATQGSGRLLLAVQNALKNK